MVKNLPTVERSTKIRFGKNVPDSDVQAENTIVFNASNTLVTTPNSGSIYMSPVRFRNDLSDPDIVLMMYNRTTGELSESGDSANALIGGVTLQNASDRGNTTSNVVQFINPEVSFVTFGNVGVANTIAGHTLDVGSNLYVDDLGPNVLVVSGGVSIDGNLVVTGGLTTITTENLKVKDAIIELGLNNTSEDTTLDLGLIMTRPESNVTIGFREGSDELVLAYTESSAESNTIVPLTSETLDVHVYGRVFTESNVGIINTSPEHTLDVGSNLYVDEYGSNVLVVTGNTSITGDLTVDTDVLRIDSTNNKIGINTVLPDAELHVVGNVYASSNLTVDTNTFHVDVEADHVGINTKYPDAELHVIGNVYASSNLTVDTNTFHVDVEADHVGINTKYPDAELHVVGNVYASSNLTVDVDTLHVDVEADHVGINTKYPDAELHVVGNVYASSNLTVDVDTLHVDVEADHVGINTKYPDAELHVVGNVYTSSNLTVDLDTFHVDVEADHVGINTKYPDAELHVVGNVYASSNLTVDTDTFHVDVEADHVGINTKYPDAELHVVGNVYASSNLTVDLDTFHVDVEADHVGINTKYPDAELHVVGNVYASSNLTVDLDTFHVDVEADHVGINTKYPDAELHVVGNVYASSNLTVDTNTFHVDVEADHVGINTKYPDAELHVVGNVYASSNLTVDTDTFHVDVEADHVGINTKYPDAELHVVGNAYVSNTLKLDDPTTALITDLTANVEVKLNQLTNVTIDTTTLANEDILVYDGSNWTNQLQNHTFLYAKAEETIDKGDAVYATGSIGNNMFSIQKAQANSSATMPALGVAYQDFALNQEGLIVTFGRADGINTDNFQTGETVYVSNVTAGALSNVKPYGATDLIQNIGLVVKGHPSTGIVSVTGVGRSNDIPNAPIVADEGDINYVYVNDDNNDLKKILPTNLLTQLQTLQQVTDTGNTTSNTIQFTDVTTGLVTVGNVEVGGNISISDLIDPQKKYLTMVNQDGFLQKSPVYVDKDTGVYVIEAAEAEFQGNLTLSGNTTILNSESVTISDRIFGVAANNSASQLDSGFMIEHQEGDPLEYANVALIYHADEHRFSISYTQNTFTDNHILHYEDEEHRMLIDLRGNVQIQNNTTIGETLDVTGATTIADDLTVGAASNLFVDVSSSRVGINEASPTVSLDVGGDARVQSTTDTATRTAGALVVSGGLGVASNIHSTNVYAVSHVGVGTDAATAPLHLLVSGTGETTNGIYMKSAAGSATNDAIVNLEVAADGGDAFVTWNASGGEAFAMGLDRSESLLTIANSSSDLTTNARLRMATDGAVTLTNATNATSKASGALIVGGGLGVAGDIYATNTNFEDVEADSVNITDATTSDSTTTGALRVAGGVGIVENIFVGGTGKIEDATDATTTTSGALQVVGGLGVAKTVFAADLSSGSVDVTDATGSTTTTTGALTVGGGVGIVENLFVGGTGKIEDATDATTTTSGALQVVGGLGVAKTVFAADMSSGSVDVTDATGSTTTTTGALTVGGGVGIVENIFVGGTGKIEDATDATTTTSGALQVVGGLGVAKTVFAADMSSGSVDVTDITEATSSTTGALKVAGGVGIAKDVYVGERAYVTGGLITNTGGVTKKTYSFSGDLASAQTIADSTIKITFSAHVFYAKIVAHLVESDDEVSTLSMECGGGHWTGGTPLAIAKGPVSIFGSTSTNPWSSTITTTTTEVSFKPTTNMAVAGHYNVFIEYISQSSSGVVSKITEGTTDVVTFGY
jgi:enhancing lycopene biosynthesis protein 2